MKVRFSIFAAVVLGVLSLPPKTRAENAPESAPPAPQTPYVDDWVALQARLGATNEEWSVLYPTLRRIADLRDELRATPNTTANRKGLFADALNTPMGGTSLDAPVMPKGSGRGTPQERPFDPKTAPGAPTANIGVLRSLLGRVFIELVLPEQRNPLQTALTELQTLLDSAATDEQLRDKLAVVRAVRGKLLRDLAAAQKELVPYLTVQQHSLLMSLGYLD